MGPTFEIFGQYKLFKRLAAGGMAEVFLAVHLSEPDKVLALKRILPDFSDNTDFIAQFQREAYIVRQLQHPGIVAVKDSGVERHQLFLSMEYIAGKSLSDLLNAAQSRGEFLPVELVTYLAAQISSALAYAHQVKDSKTGENLDIVHADLSHHNVMIGFDGQVKIIDFGIARLRAQTEINRDGKIQGKLGYLSPEQVRREPIDARTDIFAMGILLWEMIAYESLFLSPEVNKSVENVLKKEMPSLANKLPDEFKGLDDLIARCLAKNVEQRYSSMNEVKADLIAFLRPGSRERLRAFLEANFQVQMDESQRQIHELLEKHRQLDSSSASAVALNRDQSDSKTESGIDDDTATESLAIYSPEMARRRTSGFSTQNDSMRSSLLSAFMLVLFSCGALLVIGYLAFPKMMKQLEVRLQGNTVGVLEFQVLVESLPPGAEIWVNDRSTGLLTPTTMTFKNPAPVAISLRKKGFEIHRWATPVDPQKYNKQKLNAQLEKLRPALLTFTSRRLKTVTLKVNGTIYEDIELPLKDFSVPSDQPVEIEAYLRPNSKKFFRKLTPRSDQRLQIDIVL